VGLRFAAEWTSEPDGYAGGRCPACGRETILCLLLESVYATIDGFRLFRLSATTFASCARCRSRAKLRREVLPIVEANRLAPSDAEPLLRALQSREEPEIPIVDRRPFSERIELGPFWPDSAGYYPKPVDPAEAARRAEHAAEREAWDRAALERARASAPGPFAKLDS
jgi:hypothetical protein